MVAVHAEITVFRPFTPGRITLAPMPFREPSNSMMTLLARGRKEFKSRPSRTLGSGLRHCLHTLVQRGERGMRSAISGSHRPAGSNRRKTTRHTQWCWQHAVGLHSPGPTGCGFGQRGRHHTPVADVRVPRHAAIVVLDTPHLLSCGELKEGGQGLRTVINMLRYIVTRVFNDLST